MRFPYTPKDLNVSENGTASITFEYELDDQVFTKTIPIFGTYTLEYFDQSIQNWINTHKTQLDAIKSVNDLKTKFGDILGQKIDMTQEELNQVITDRENN